MKRYIKERDGVLEVGQALYTKRFTLRLERSLCRGCELCKLVCPREAITLVPQSDQDGKALPPLVDVDENKCDFHGICAVVCPFGAITISMNGEDGIPAVAKGVFPTLTRDLSIDAERCQPGCTKCAEACPLDIIDVNEERGATAAARCAGCAGCQICWMACPTDAIEVTKFIEGSIKIDADICPEGCHRCLDVCPVNAMALDEDGKVYVTDMNCIYCGACAQVCPREGALRIERTAIRHSPVNSGAWHKGLEKLTSATGLMRELSAENTAKAREATKNLEAAEGKA